MQVIWFIVVVVIIAVAFSVFVVQRAIRAHQYQVSAGREELVGKTAVVKVALKPKGVVLIQGEHWTTISEKDWVEPEEEVVITRVDGLRLWVIKKG